MATSIGPIAAFTFHEVCDDPRSSGLQRRAAMPYKHTRAQFRAVLDAIGESGLRPGTITGDVVASDQKRLALTFDDGGHSATDAARELDRRGWKGNFFIVSDFIGQAGFMDTAAIRDLHQAGHLIGNHSKSHPDIFRALSPAAMRDEWTACRDRLQTILSAPCDVASVPGGDISMAVFRSASDSGIRYLFTSDPTPHPVPHSNCLVLGRASVKASTPPDHCARLARFEGWGQERAIYHTKQFARLALSPIYRHYVRWTTKPFEREA